MTLDQIDDIFQLAVYLLLVFINFIMKSTSTYHSLSGIEKRNLINENAALAQIRNTSQVGKQRT